MSMQQPTSGYDNPRMRRLRADHAALERLARESSVLTFDSFGTPPSRYIITFEGKTLFRDKSEQIVHAFSQKVEIKLGASYPRTMPELRWVTPIYHPNISEIGMVCLGGYGTHWVPGLTLDELCVMLWDMARYQNYDIRSPYNRYSAIWASHQTQFLFPTDSRSLRDRRIAQGRISEETPRAGVASSSSSPALALAEPPVSRPERSVPPPDVVFLD